MHNSSVAKTCRLILEPLGTVSIHGYQFRFLRAPAAILTESRVSQLLIEKGFLEIQYEDDELQYELVENGHLRLGP